jgi:hypothetical protein
LNSVKRQPLGRLIAQPVRDGCGKKLTVTMLDRCPVTPRQ